MPVLSREFLDILCCPKRRCRGDLFQRESAHATDLECTLCHDRYEIVDGIPILFPNATYSPTIHKRHWDQERNAKSYAEKYDHYLQKEGTPWGLYTHESEIQAIKQLTNGIDLQGKTILDCGTGNGRLLSAYPESGRRIGIDTSLVLLEAQKQRAPDHWLVCGQLEDMPFKDAIADFSTSIRVYQHLRSPQEAFAEMVRVTRPSGYVSLEVYNAFNLKTLYKKFRMLPFIQHIAPWGLNFDPYYSYREINEWCKETFVKPIRWSGAGWGIHFYVFEIFQFNRFVPKIAQRIVYNFYLRLEQLVGTRFFFSKTLEKVCFIGSVQAVARPTILERAKQKLSRRSRQKSVNHFIEVLNDRNYALIASDKEHLRQTIDWIARAQDATPDGGVSRGNSLFPSAKANPKGWQPSYPETTGYIIPTMIEAGKFFGNTSYFNRARLMGEWELNIQRKDGSVHGGNIAEESYPAVFDTGAVLRGYYSLYKETRDQRYVVAARNAANWILSHEKNKTGEWKTNNAKSVSQEMTTYNIYAMYSLALWGKELNETEWVDTARRAAHATLRMQSKNGWFAGCDFRDGENPLLHTIAYTIDGLWDIGVLLKEKEFQIGAMTALNGVLSLMDDKGSIPGKIGRNWESAASWTCLTGSAQIGITLMKVSRESGDKSYKIKATLLKEYLKAKQNNFDPERGGGVGAMWGSWPISGDYGSFQSLNWAAKYFADLLLEFVAE